MNRNKVGFLYFMKNLRNGLVKIGFSQNPQYREQTLQSEEPEICLLFFFEATHECERNMHDIYEKQRVRGEWFRLTDEDIVFNACQDGVVFPNDESVLLSFASL